MKQKLQFDVVDKQSSTPLQLAIGAQHFDTFKVRAGLPFSVHAVELRMAFRQLLLEKGADSNKADDRGETPMHYCARHDFWKVRFIV